MMSKPKKLTEGHSSGPQAHWDSISDAKKDTASKPDIVEQLRSVDAEIEQLRDTNHYLNSKLIEHYIENKRLEH